MWNLQRVLSPQPQWWQFSLGGPSAEAQSFGQVNPNGTVYVPLVLDTTAALPGDADTIGPAFIPNEFPLDPNGWHNNTTAGDDVPWATVRLAANLRQQYRILGNPFIRSAIVRFTNLALDWLATTDGIQTSHDFVELGWSGATPIQRTGSLASDWGDWGGTVDLGVTASGTNSLTSPGMTFRLVTGPDIGEAALSSARDRESWGFETQRIAVTGTSLGATTVPTMGLYDNIIAVLLPTNDTVRMIAPQTGHPVSILMWAPSTSTTTQGQLSTIREQFRRAAWLFFGMTGGSHVIRSYRFYNNSWCDAFPDTACDGGSSDLCVEATGSADCVSTVTVPADTTNYRQIAHEFGHCLTRISGFDGLRDEYRSGICSGSKRPTCPHTIMTSNGMPWNARYLCTDQNHWRTGVTWDI